jgi:two-component system LytT family response regulator
MTEGQLRVAHTLRLSTEEMQDDATGEAIERSVPLSRVRTADHVRRLLVRDGEGARFVRITDVDYIEADGNYAVIHVGDVRHRLRATLRILAERLDPDLFVRIHKSHIVNIDRISVIHSWLGGDYVAILQNGRRLRVSRTYASGLLQPLR